MHSKNSESEFVRHSECSNCGSSDANSIYSDGHTYCFVCETHTQGEGKINHTHQMNHVHLQGAAQRLQKRGLSEKTCQLYKIYREGDLLRFYYFTNDGVLQGAKDKNQRQNL